MSLASIFSAMFPAPTMPAQPTRPPDAPTARPDNFPACVAFTLSREGGFVNNPRDPGGATNFGITLATLQAWRGWPITADDVRALKRGEAVAIYRANYWQPAGCAGLPPGVDLMVFDCAVNSGVRTSAKLLQRAVGVTDDGAIGPDTLRAVYAIGDQAELIAKLAAVRLSYCRSLGAFAVFGKGWTERINAAAKAATGMTT